jgi:hypothetical protein
MNAEKAVRSYEDLPPKPQGNPNPDQREVG